MSKKREQLLAEATHRGSVQTVDTEVQKQEQPAPAQQPQRKVRVGFTAAVLEDGEFVFNIHGTNPGLIELNGLVEFARKVVDAQMKDQLNIDEAAILGHLNTLTKQVAEITEKVRSLSAS